MNYRLLVLIATPLLAASCTSSSNDTGGSAFPSTPITGTSTSLPSYTPETRLTLNGLGPLVVGADVQQAAKLAGVTITEDDSATGDASCQVGTINGGGFGGVSVLTEEHKIARVDITQDESGNPSPIKTVEGIGIGDTEDAVKQAYGSVKVEPHEYVEGGHYLSYSDPANPNRLLLFETDGKRVTAFRSGRTDFVSLVEHCL